MFKRALLATILAVGTVGAASAAPITGSFSLTSFAGSYVGGTAATATGLDFGAAGGGVGNGYGTNGSAFVGNATGSFSGLMLASISDISLGATANPYTANPFLSFTGSNIVVNFSNAALTRSPSGTSITVTGNAMFSDGIAADASTGVFTLATSSQNGMSTDVNFTFSSNASTTAVPEPISISLLGASLIGMGVVRLRRKN